MNGNRPQQGAGHDDLAFLQPVAIFASLLMSQRKAASGESVSGAGSVKTFPSAAIVVLKRAERLACEAGLRGAEDESGMEIVVR
ncbi:MAG: hypothetical protein WDN49_05565 [Acetobacteraceae bacterium]